MLLGGLGGESDFGDCCCGRCLSDLARGVGGQLLEGQFEAVLRGGGAEVGEGDSCAQRALETLSVRQMLQCGYVRKCHTFALCCVIGAFVS